ncbi:uncharacterized protein LOC122852341 [Aphidius gifuensis]|uniref:uncharacterized protein LOC122852341 n=1 Tax=Aphidius gifuensis TaxID=684658 RepID=UPI001CDD62B8|nr:uncharacterized protein LOC122852341 [Aphidius gifuensis]
MSGSRNVILLLAGLLCLPIALYIIVFSSEWAHDIYGRDFDVVVFSQTLPMAVCGKLHIEDPSKRCSIPDHTNWTIHGIFPFLLNKAGPGSCKESAKINMSILATLKNQLINHWPDLRNQTTTWSQSIVPTIIKPVESNMTMILKNENSYSYNSTLMAMSPDDPINSTTIIPVVEYNESTTIDNFEIEVDDLIEITTAPSTRVAREIPTIMSIIAPDFNSKNLAIENITQETTMFNFVPSTLSTTTVSSETTRQSDFIATDNSMIVTPLDFNFWLNEWQKHGTCGFGDSNENQFINYFKKAISLSEKYNINKLITKANIYPGNSYSPDKIINNISNILGARCRIKCFWNEKKQKSYLIEISICLDKNQQLTDCNKFGGLLTNCKSDYDVLYIDENNYKDIINDRDDNIES